MANVLNEEKKQQVLALGRLGWSLRRIQQAAGIRLETASAHLTAAGITARPLSGRGWCEPKPANEVITDSGAAKPAIPFCRGGHTAATRPQKARRESGLEGLLCASAIIHSSTNRAHPWISFLSAEADLDWIYLFTIVTTDGSGPLHAGAPSCFS